VLATQPSTTDTFAPPSSRPSKATEVARAKVRRRPAITFPIGAMPGLVVCVALGYVAVSLGHAVPVFGGPAFGIVFGMALSVVAPLQAPLRVGAGFASRQLLQLSVVILGAELSLHDVLRTGLSSLPVMLGTLALALIGARVFGRLLGVEGSLRTLVGVGTGVCGASAIAAVTRVIGAAETDVAYSLSTIFAFNVVAVLLYPPLGHLMGMSQHAFGLWGGTAINDTSSVVAATATYGTVASSYGVIVKLTRALMIVPICAWLAMRRAKLNHSAGVAQGTDVLRWWRLVPWFIGYFLLAVVANTVGVVPATWHAGLSTSATFLITVALVGVGLSARFGQMRRSGLRPLALGAALWATVGVSSLALQAIFRG
jgi:uncharacterized integral membrane protein (TIGR00698 family)